MRRSLGVVLWSLVGLLACFLGALAALVGTGPGRALLTQALRGTLDRVLAGRVEVADIGGTLLTGLTLRDVRLYDRDSTLVAWLPGVELAYNPFDFAAGRVVLQEARLERPQFNLVQHPDGRFNLERLLHLGEPDTAPRPRGPAPLILLRNVAVVGGSLVMRLQDDPSAADSLLEIDEFGPDGRRRVRRFDGLELELAALRLSAPRAPGIRVEITRLAVAISDPAVTIRDAAGVVTIRGDSLALDLPRLALPGSQLALTGHVTWPQDTVLYDLDVVADSATLGDLAWIDPRFPAEARVRGAAAVRSGPGDALLVRLDPIDVRFHGGRLNGKVTTHSQGSAGVVRISDGDLEARNVDLELARPFLDTLPFAGRLTGRTIVDGPIAALGLDIDWWFRDSLVAGWPETRLVGRGAVDLTHADGLAFAPFTLDTVTLPLASARRLVPALSLQGTLDGTGTLEGPYTDARWTGALRHTDGSAPPSLVRGTFRLDGRGDTLGVSADLTADTLALAGLRGSFPGLALDAALTGTVRLEGTLADLETHAHLATLDGSGRVRVDGWLTLLAPPLGARDLQIVATDVDARAWLGARAPVTRLTFGARGDVRADSGPPAGTFRVDLAPSLFARAALDSGRAVVRFAEGRAHFDTLRLVQGGVIARASGTLGWRAPQTGTLAVTLDAQTLEGLDSLAAWLVGMNGTARDTLAPLQGAGRVDATLAGALDSLTLDARAEVRSLAWRDWSVTAATARVRWDGGGGQFAAEAAADSVALGELGLGGAAARVAGRADSLSWFARTRVGDWLAVLGGGELVRHADTTAARVDSLAVLLPGEVWLLERPGDVRLTPAAVTLPDSGLVWRRAGGSGTVALTGGVPRDSAAQTRLLVREFPLAALAVLARGDTAGARGRVDADVALRGTHRDPEMDATFVVTGVAAGPGAPLVARGGATYRGRRLDSRLAVSRGDRGILDVTAHLPIDLSLAAVAERQVPDTLWARAVADSVDLGQLGLLDAFAQRTAGRVSADLTLRGRWDSPTLAGRAAVRGAAATIRSLNVRYEDVNGSFTFVGDTVRVDSLSLRSGAGRLSVGGYLRFERLTRPLLALELEARDFRALEVRNYMTVTASGRVAVRGPVFGATLTGRGTVNAGVLYFADLVTKRVVNLDEPWVATLIAPEELRAQELDRGFPNRFLDSLRIRELTLVMGSDVWLRSTEANIQLTGDVSVSKEGPNYRLSGTLQAPRGSYRLVIGDVLSKEFVVTDGTVRYFGTPDLNAELNITARHEVRTVARAGDESQVVPITAQIGGTLLVPRLRLSVEGQTLSQTEIMSYLVFGRPQFELGGGAGFSGSDAVLKGALASVAGELERTLVSDLGVPLDYVEIRPGPDRVLSGALLAAGWQIGDRTFLTLNAGFCEGQPVSLSSTIGAALQFRISSEWRTEASFEPLRICGQRDVESGLRSVPRQLGLDLFWERRY